MKSMKHSLNNVVWLHLYSPNPKSMNWEQNSSNFNLKLKYWGKISFWNLQWREAVQIERIKSQDDYDDCLVSTFKKGKSRRSWINSVRNFFCKWLWRKSHGVLRLRSQAVVKPQKKPRSASPRRRWQTQRTSRYRSADHASANSPFRSWSWSSRASPRRTAGAMIFCIIPSSF